MRPFTLFLIALGMSIAAADAVCADSAEGLDEVVVTATLQQQPLQDVPASVTVLDAETLKQAGQQHLADVLALVPNLNWAGDTSRPRYFQIRGIGELEQYQGAPNPSVGFLIDDIDFSGLGTIATLYDVDRIEVLRGPQGMRYGANALGGLIYARSAEPTDRLWGAADVDLGDYGERSYGLIVSGPVPALDSGFRLAAQHYASDGYYDNVYLHSNDTDRRGELTLRGRWRYQPSDRLNVDISLLRVQIDNGYDAFTLDGSRNTQSDTPGVDEQHSTGVSIHADYRASESIDLTLIGSFADSRVKYSYDGDWGNPVLWAPYLYQYNDVQYRHRTTHSLEARLASAQGAGAVQWLIGVYGLQLHEGYFEDSEGLFYDPSEPGPVPSPSDNDTISHYQSRNGALFGELSGDWGKMWHWTLGLRGERWTARYGDQIIDPAATHDFRPEDNLWGGEASLTRQLATGQNAYVSVERGYKTGGFNLSEPLLPSQLEFGPESDLSVEGGYKVDLPAAGIRLDSDVFYIRRTSLQVKTSEQLVPSNPDTFVYYTGNASSGFNYGLESEAQWQATRVLAFGAALGLLQTRYRGFVQNGQPLPDRELPNAPPWQAAVNATYHHPAGAFARLDLTGMGGYYFDLPPNWTTSHPYGLVNGRIGWETRRWSATVWGRNLLDKRYPVRGFYFSDTPRDFLANPPVSRLYTQLGDPRAWGISLHYEF